MVCVAAFIILCLISVIVGFLSIFKRDIGAKWWKVFKKAWHCVFKKVRLQKCDTNFKEDVKNSILKKVVVKHPKWTKPISIAIEIVAVLIVLITVWSIVIAIKSLLALWVFGTCNVSQPSQCALGAEVCSIDQAEPRNIFEKIGRGIGEWGEIFSAIPDRIKTWDADSFDIPTVVQAGNKDGEPALAIIDPGCSVCMQSYRNLQSDTEFLEKYNIKTAVYPIKLPDGSYKFKHSGLIARYLYAMNIIQANDDATKCGYVNYADATINKIFTQHNEQGINYQAVINNEPSDYNVARLIGQWLEGWGASTARIEQIESMVNDSAEIDELMSKATQIIEQEVKPKGIPVMIYDGKKHNGLFQQSTE